MQLELLQHIVVDQLKSVLAECQRTEEICNKQEDGYQALFEKGWKLVQESYPRENTTDREECLLEFIDYFCHVEWRGEMQLRHK